MCFLEQDWVPWHFPDYGMEPVSILLQLNVQPGMVSIWPFHGEDETFLG